MDDRNQAASATFGQMVWMYMQSPLHRDWAISTMHQWLLPPLMHDQYQLYQEESGSRPVGLVTWAWLSEEVEQAYVRNPTSLKPSQWKSGKRGWIIDFIAPFGNASDIVRDLREDVFPTKVGRFLRFKKDQDTLKIMYIHGAKTLGLDGKRTPNPAVLPKQLDELPC